MRVVFFHRKPTYGVSYSLEKSFDTLRFRLAASATLDVVVARFPSRGFLRRSYNAIEAAFHQGDINHITGDIHYLSYFLQKRKTVLTVHDCGHAAGRTGIRAMLFRWLWLRIPARRVAVITTVSQFTKDELSALIPLSRGRAIRVVPTLISPIFRHVDYEFSKTCPNVLQVGTTFNKNLHRVAKALIGVSCHLTVVGVLSPLQREELSASGISWDNVSHLSEPELLAVYTSSDLLLFVSTYEGFGMPILEAQTVGRPVVTSRLAAMPEIAGDGACFVDPFDVGSIRAGVQRVIGDDHFRAHLVSRGLNNITRFSPERVAQGYMTVYETLSKPRHAGGSAAHI